jgi:tRNA A-37 threonylcarbamoyl transferase component Bud32
VPGPHRVAIDRRPVAYEVAAGAAPRTEASSLERGSTVHRYVILDRVGEGGMGVVYAAYDPRLDRRVALKFLSRRGGRDERLLREAQAMARLAHPNVAVVYEVDEVEGRPFLAMEFVDGVDLRAWLADRRRSFEQVVEVFRGAGRRLAAAHAAGIVHRDFKPSNVLLDRGDRPRVTDFGLSRAARETDDEEAEVSSDHLALDVCRKAFKIISREVEEDSSYLVPTRVCLGEALIGMGDLRGARAELEQSLTPDVVRDTGPRLIALGRFHMARALWMGGERRQARELARAAVDSLVPAEGDNRAAIERIQNWLTAHGESAREQGSR